MRPFALLLALIMGFVTPAAAEYPERALTIVVAYPAGGLVDIVARPMADCTDPGAAPAAGSDRPPRHSSDRRSCG